MKIIEIENECAFNTQVSYSNKILNKTDITYTHIMYFLTHLIPVLYTQTSCIRNRFLKKMTKNIKTIDLLYFHTSNN